MRGPATLLVFLSTAADTWVVAADLWRVALDDLGLRRRGLAPVGHRHLRLALLLLLLHPLDVFLARELDRVELLDDVGVEAVDEILEHVEPLALILLQGILLPVAAETDALLQVVHREEMVLPELVDGVQHHDLLEVPHDG